MNRILPSQLVQGERGTKPGALALPTMISGPSAPACRRTLGIAWSCCNRRIQRDALRCRHMGAATSGNPNMTRFSTPFHVAMQVRNIAEARHFYGPILGCIEGRSDAH